VSSPASGHFAGRKQRFGQRMPRPRARSGRIEPNRQTPSQAQRGGGRYGFPLAGAKVRSQSASEFRHVSSERRSARNGGRDAGSAMCLAVGSRSSNPCLNYTNASAARTARPAGSGRPTRNSRIVCARHVRKPWWRGRDVDSASLSEVAFTAKQRRGGDSKPRDQFPSLTV
jgi:hypothetical protein